MKRLKIINNCPNKHSFKRRAVLPYCWKCVARLNDEEGSVPFAVQQGAKVIREEFTVSSDDLIEKVKQLLHERNVTRIIVKDEKGKALLEIPATVGIIGCFLLPGSRRWVRARHSSFSRKM